MDVPWLLRKGSDRGARALRCPLFLAAVGAPLGFLAFLLWAGLTDRWTDWADPIGLGVILALGGSLLLLLATSGVRVRPGLVVVTGLLIRSTVPVELVRQLRWDDGFTLSTSDGAQIEAMALGASLLAAMTGNRRQRNTAVRVARWMAATSAVRYPPRQVGIRWRYVALTLCAFWSTGSAASVITVAAIGR